MLKKTKFFTDLKYLNKKTLLVTGATGSFGTAMIEKLLQYANLKRLVIFSHNNLYNKNKLPHSIGSNN